MGVRVSITEAEWEVMTALWEHAPQTAAELTEQVEHRKWTAKTVRTLLSRLVDKGAVKFTARGRTHLYRPAIDRDTCTRAEAKSFLDRIFGGSVAPMIAQLAAHDELAEEDLEALRKILKEKDER